MRNPFRRILFPSIQKFSSHSEQKNKYTTNAEKRNSSILKIISPENKYLSPSNPQSKGDTRSKNNSVVQTQLGIKSLINKWFKHSTENKCFRGFTN